VGLPEAAAVKLTVEPTHIVWLDGDVVTIGGVLTDNVAAAESTLLRQALLNLARYCLPLSEALVVTFNVELVAPLMSVKIPPPSMLTCHCNAGVGLPVAVAVKLATNPAQTT
jgi:hypothetical protein